MRSDQDPVFFLGGRIRSGSDQSQPGAAKSRLGSASRLQGFFVLFWPILDFKAIFCELEVLLIQQKENALHVGQI